MTIDQFLQKAADAFQFDLTPERKRKLTARLKLADYSEVGQKDMSICLDIVAHAIKSEQLATTKVAYIPGVRTASVNAGSESVGSCPRCHKAMQPVMLANNLKASYCEACRLTTT